MRLPNPCDRVEVPSNGKRRRNFFSKDEVASVLASVEKKSPFWHPAVLLDLVSGLHWGELSSLRWSDIDEARGVIRVCRGNYKGTELDSTKTGDDEDEPKGLRHEASRDVSRAAAHRERSASARGGW